jgi:hypothetical protein
LDLRYNLVILKEDKLRRFLAAILKKLRDVPGFFPKKKARSVCHVPVAR